MWARTGKAVVVDHFGGIENGTGIAFYRGALYAASPTAIWRYGFAGREIIPTTAPERIVDGMPTGGSPSHGIAIDGKGHSFLSVAETTIASMRPRPRAAPIRWG